MKLKVAAVSSNRNAFGLRNMIFVGDNGEAWQAAANDLNIRQRDTVLEVPDWQDIPTFLTGENFEIPERLHPDPPPELLKVVWS